MYISKLMMDDSILSDRVSNSLFLALTYSNLWFFPGTKFISYLNLCSQDMGKVRTFLAEGTVKWKQLSKVERTNRFIKLTKQVRLSFKLYYSVTMLICHWKFIYLTLAACNTGSLIKLSVMSCSQRTWGINF